METQNSGTHQSSLLSNIEICKAYCEEHGLTCYLVDEGKFYSVLGVKAGRDGLQELCTVSKPASQKSKEENNH